MTSILLAFLTTAAACNSGAESQMDTSIEGQKLDEHSERINSDEYLETTKPNDYSEVFWNGENLVAYKVSGSVSPHDLSRPDFESRWIWRENDWEKQLNKAAGIEVAHIGWCPPKFDCEISHVPKPEKIPLFDSEVQTYPLAATEDRVIIERMVSYFMYSDRKDTQPAFLNDEVLKLASEDSKCFKAFADPESNEVPNTKATTGHLEIDNQIVKIPCSYQDIPQSRYDDVIGSRSGQGIEIDLTDHLNKDQLDILFGTKERELWVLKEGEQPKQISELPFVVEAQTVERALFRRMIDKPIVFQGDLEARVPIYSTGDYFWTSDGSFLLKSKDGLVWEKVTLPNSDMFTVVNSSSAGGFVAAKTCDMDPLDTKNMREYQDTGESFCRASISKDNGRSWVEIGKDEVLSVGPAGAVTISYETENYQSDDSKSSQREIERYELIDFDGEKITEKIIEDGAYVGPELNITVGEDKMLYVKDKDNWFTAGP